MLGRGRLDARSAAVERFWILPAVCGSTYPLARLRVDLDAGSSALRLGGSGAICGSGERSEAELKIAERRGCEGGRATFAAWGHRLGRQELEQDPLRWASS